MSRVVPGSEGLEDGLRTSFAKAAAREPLLGAGLGFVPPASRPAYAAWCALLGELRECLFERSDPRVSGLKAGWWAEELRGWGQGAWRHPVGRPLAAPPGLGPVFPRIAAHLAAVAADSDPPADESAAFAALRPLAEAVVQGEARLFGSACDAATVDALATHWLRQRLEHGLEAADRARVPLVFFARHGLRREQLPAPEAAALRRDWALRLRDRLPTGAVAGLAYPRQLSLRGDRIALEALAAGRNVPGTHALGLVWQAWRLARRSAIATQCSTGLTSTAPPPT